MMSDNIVLTLFVGFAFLVQLLLIINFAARNWQPAIERKYGWLIYAMGVAGIIVGFYFIAQDQPWYIAAAPFVYAIWAAFGFYVDTYRPVQWRSPRRLSVFIPYVSLFVASQFFFWIPLWTITSGLWIIYGALYFINTGLNIYSHRKPELANA